MDEAKPAHRGAGAVIADYYQISKPRILLLLLIVAWAAMFVASGGAPEWRPWLAVTLAGTFSTAAAGALNHVIERRRDAKMGRTASRPVASGRISVGAAVTYAAIMAFLSVAVLAYDGHILAAALTAGAIAYYVVVYTVVLKPATPQNIVIGGLAGSFPAVIGWTVVTESLAWPAALPALILASLVFLWTPPHFWSLALLYKDEYAAADYPMMPNVRGEASTRRQIFAYSLLTFLASLMLIATGDAGWIYLGAALLMGGLLMGRSWRLLVVHNDRAYRSYFFFTIQYLGLLLIGLIVDRMFDLPAIPLPV